MKLGISSYAFAWGIGVAGHPPADPMTPMDLLGRANAMGVRLIQVCDNAPLERLTQAQLDAFLHQAQAWDIEIEVGTRGIARDHLRAYLALAERCGASICRVVVDTAAHHASESEIVDVARDLLPEFQRAGVCLAVENHDRFTARALADLMERIDHPAIGICLDTTNSFGALEGPEVVVNTLAPWVVNLHIKDFDVFRVPHSMGFIVEGRPAGQGRLNVPWILETLRQHGRDPNALLELWPPPEAALEATIRKEATWAEESVRYLRTLIPN